MSQGLTGALNAVLRSGAERRDGKQGMGMTSEADDLIAWCEGQRAEALRQIELFGAGGVKAFL